MSLSSVLLAIFFFVGCALCQSTIQLQFSDGASIWWLAVAPQNDNQATTKMEIRDNMDSSFALMTANPGWGYYTYSVASGRAISLPAVFKLTSASGDSFEFILYSLTPGQLVDTGFEFGAVASAPKALPATAAPPTARPLPATAPPTAPPTARPPPPAAATTRPVSATVAPATVPATAAPTAASTAAPTAAPTAVPASNADLCSVTPTSDEPVKLLVPLYVYPGSAWDAVIAAANSSKIIAIINPNSGPLATVDGAYTRYMAKLKQAGVELVGYVHTSYGARPIANVKADIDTYVSKYPLVTGIFLDEGATDASQLHYYKQAYNHIMDNKAYKHSIINPGLVPDRGYLDISTNIVIFENYASSVTSTFYPSWVKCAPSAAHKNGYKYKFSGIVHTASIATQAAIISNLHAGGMGLVYVTDGLGGCCTYNTLTSYMSAEASAVAAINN